VARGAKYEDPLTEALQRAGFGTVVGGGSLLNAKREIERIDIEMSLRNLDGALSFARSTLASLGAPTGTLLLFLREERPRGLVVGTTAEEFDCPEALAALRRRLALVGPPSTEAEDRVEKMARKLIGDFEGLWLNAYDYPAADLTQYSADWLEWYDAVRRQLMELGYVKAGDIATVRQNVPGAAPVGFSRKFHARDGRVRIDAFQVAAAKPKPPVQVVVCKTEFSDGTFLGTSNALLRWNAADFVDDERLAPSSTAGDVTARHLLRLEALCKLRPSPQVVEILSLADLLASEARERSLTGEFRRQQQIPTVEELTRLGAKPEFAREVHQRMRQIKGL
jgi:hypothetical protein